MNIFRNLSIKGKLKLIIMTTTVVALVLASCLLEQYSHDTYAAVLASVTASQTGVRK